MLAFRVDATTCVSLLEWATLAHRIPEVATAALRFLQRPFSEVPSTRHEAEVLLQLATRLQEGDMAVVEDGPPAWEELRRVVERSEVKEEDSS